MIKMAGEHGTLQAFAAVVTIWGTIFFGVWALPLSEQIKFSIDVVSSIGIGVLALIYFMRKGTIPIPKKQTLDRVSFWLGIIQLILMVGTTFYLSVITWEVVTIDGVNVVTYTNLISLYYGVLAVVSLIFAVWYVINKNPYKKQKLKDLEVYSPIHSMIVRVNKKIPRETALKSIVGVWVDKSLMNFEKISALFDQHSDKFRDEDLKMWIDIEEEIKRGKNGSII
jgi:hypothetical protein